MPSRLRQVLKSSLIVPAFCLIAITGSAGAAHATVSLSGLFSDHMVVQSDQPIKVWGTAEPRELIGVQLADKKFLATTDAKGHWQATLAPLPAGGPYQLRVVGSEEIIVKDVMVGQVWICAGQSNMALNLAQARVEEAAAAAPSDGSIRVMTLPIRIAEQPAYSLSASSPMALGVLSHGSNSRWQILDQNNARNCAAVPYFFAVQLRKKLNCPIGLVVTCAPGSPVQSWISGKALSQSAQGRGYLDDLPGQFQRYRQFQDKLSKVERKSQESELDSWRHEADQARKYGKDCPFLAPPTSYFNGMISEIAPYAAKGVLYYQGETDITNASQYEKLFTTLIRDWRSLWNSAQLPFLFVQLAPYGERQKLPSTQSPVAILRDQQWKASLVPYSYMASAVDSIKDETADLHGSNKKMIGERLATIALSTQYNQPHQFKGPTVDSVTLEGSKLRIKFKNASHGLTVKGLTLTGFAIAGDDKKFFFAKADIDGDSVVVWHVAVKQPSAVLYSWADNPDGNLYNGDDLPAVPFRAQVKPAAVVAR